MIYFNMEYLNSNNLMKCSDYVINSERNDSLENISKNCIIHCNVENLYNVFKQIKYCKNKIILITHGTDLGVNECIFKFKPKSVIKWYAQNVEYKHNDLIPIPLGIMDYEGVYKRDIFDVNYFTQVKNENRKKESKVFVSLQFTNESRVYKCYALQKQGAICYNWLDYKSYVDKISTTKYIASPRGNGFDCYRTYEALLLGSIPVVDKHFMFDTWDLPIIQVDNYFELRDKLNLPQKKYNFDQLYADYWIKQMREQLV